MEIQTAPRPATATPWGRVLLCAVVLVPLVGLVLLPIGLGLQRYVMTSGSMDGDRDGGISRGSLLLERVVPTSDLRPGDVITYQAPRGFGDDGDSDSKVTHRIVSIGADGIVTRGDAEPADDPWVLQADGPTLSRVELDVPVVGWLHLAVCSPVAWTLALVSVVALALLSRRAPRRARGEP